LKYWSFEVFYVGSSILIFFSLISLYMFGPILEIRLFLWASPNLYIDKISVFFLNNQIYLRTVMESCLIEWSFFKTRLSSAKQEISHKLISMLKDLFSEYLLRIKLEFGSKFERLWFLNTSKDFQGVWSASRDFCKVFMPICS